MNDEPVNVTSNECQVLLEAIKTSHAGLQLALETGLLGVRGEIEANTKATDNHFKQLNGKIAEHEKRINEHDDEIESLRDFKKGCEVERGKLTWARKNWLPIAIAVLFIIGIIVGIYDIIGLRGIIGAVIK